MSKLSSLMKSNFAAISKDDLEALGDLDRRSRNMKKYAWPTSCNASHSGFVKVERVYTKDPVDLFGHDAPSLAHNRMTVYRSDPSETDDEDNVIMSLLISEQSLTRLMLSSNRGSSDIPATAEVLGGLRLPRFINAESHHDQAYEKVKSQSIGRISNALDNILSSASSGASERARRTAVNDLEELKSIVSRNGDFRFYMSQRGDSYSAKRVDLVSEAAHASLHIDRVLGAGSLMIEDHAVFDADVERVTNPMLDALMGDITVEESNALGRLVHLEVSRICKIYDMDPGSLFNDKGQLKRGRDLPRMIDDARREIESIWIFSNESLNMHVVKGREKRTIHGLGLSMTQSQGHMGFIHSALPATGGDYFSLKIGSAYKAGDFGSGKIKSSHDPIIEFSMTSDDLMMMFRGHPSGAATPCTLGIVAGIHQHPPEAERHEISDVIDDLNRAVIKSDGARSVLDIISEMKNAMSEKGGGKDWKENVQRLSEDLERAVTAYKYVVMEGFDAGDDLLRKSVAKHVSKDLESMKSFLPTSVMERLSGKDANIEDVDDGFSM